MLATKSASVGLNRPRVAVSVARPTGLRCLAVAQPRRPQRDEPVTLDARWSMVATIGMAQLLAEPAFAKGGTFGILEGRTAALVHPAVMGGLFVGSLYAGYLGWQWRRTRTIAEEIKSLKAQLPKVAVPAGEASAPAPPPSPLDAQIAGLEKERKDLIAGGFRDKHVVMGNVLLGSGVTIAVAGCINTWMRTERLFPGPHLWAGAAIVVLWALAAALTPAMQKGNDTARSAHIALNAVNVALFAWQVPTGLEIVAKVFEFTQWP